VRLLLALAAGIAGYCYYRGLGARRTPKPREELTRWEGEGGNVPSVATPSPRSQYPAGDPNVRH
jgi:hypothetical protein